MVYFENIYVIWCMYNSLNKTNFEHLKTCFICMMVNKIQDIDNMFVTLCVTGVFKKYAERFHRMFTIEAR